MRRLCLEFHRRTCSGAILLALIGSISGASEAVASDLGPQAGQHVGKVIAWDSATERLVLVETDKGKAFRRIALWTDPQTAVAASRCGPENLFGHDKGCRGLTLADLKAGERVQVEWRRAGKRHVAVNVRRLP